MLSYKKYKIVKLKNSMAVLILPDPDILWAFEPKDPRRLPEAFRKREGMRINLFGYAAACSEVLPGVSEGSPSASAAGSAAATEASPVPSASGSEMGSWLSAEASGDSVDS